MDDKIKITKDLEFGYSDLMKTVDQSCPFTLRDVLRSCCSSKIPIDLLCQILRCNYILDYYDEAESRKFRPSKSDNIEYLCVCWNGEKSTYEGERHGGFRWCFNGVGKKGYVPKDVKKYGKLTKEQMKNYRCSYAIELSPMYKLTDYPIKIGDKLYIADHDVFTKWAVKREGKCPDINYEVDLTPSITLIELLHAILWELSFFGNIKERNEKLRNIVKAAKETKRAIKNGTAKFISHKEVKKRLAKKINDIKKSKKQELMISKNTRGKE